MKNKVRIGVLVIMILLLAVMIRAECPLSVVEGEKLNIKWVSSDADNDKLYYSFDGQIGADGVWQTKVGDRGVHWMKGTVNDGMLESDTKFCVNVLPAPIHHYKFVNIKSPIVISDKEITVFEGETVNLNARCTRGKMMVTGWMDSLSKETGYNDAGVHDVSVRCYDGIYRSTNSVKVNVIDVKRSLILTGSKHVTTFEYDTVLFDNNCVDPDGSPVVKVMPLQNVYKKAGEYQALFKCSSRSGKFAQQVIDVTVLKRNNAPMISWQKI